MTYCPPWARRRRDSTLRSSQDSRDFGFTSLGVQRLAQRHGSGNSRARFSPPGCGPETSEIFIVENSSTRRFAVEVFRG